MVKIITGSRKIDAAAATAGQSSPPTPMLVGMNGGAVCAVPDVSKTANAYSFHEKIRQKMAVDAMPVAVTEAAPIVVSHPSEGWLARMISSLGGWTAMGGLTTALVVGFGIGIAPPDAIETFATDLLGGTAVEQIEDVLWSFDSSLLEG